MIGKARLAAEITWEEFSADDDAAAFVAYFTARYKFRSEFTIEGQQRAFDEIAQMLLQRCGAGGVVVVPMGAASSALPRKSSRARRRG